MQEYGYFISRNITAAGNVDHADQWYQDSDEEEEQEGGREGKDGGMKNVLNQWVQL